MRQNWKRNMFIHDLKKCEEINFFKKKLRLPEVPARLLFTHVETDTQNIFFKKREII